MATSTANYARCAACGKAAGTFTCRGCFKDFCLRHTNEHRQELTKQIDEDIIPLHNQLRQNFDEATEKGDSHPSTEQIDEWEQISIAKIHEVADDARKQLLTVRDTHISNLKETLEHLTQQLNKARDDDHFFETDLQEWLKQLHKLKKDFVSSPTINIQYDNNPIAFISKIRIGEPADVSNAYFEQFIGNIQITNNGTVITHNQSAIYASVRGIREYSKGEHHLRLMIENLSFHKWIFVGVISKIAIATTSPSISTTCYGFSGENNIWCNGARRTTLNDYRSNFKTNDTIELFINCDQRKIRLINERTRNTYSLDVDISSCPFPWKLNVGFFYSPGDRIRILM